MPITWTNDDFTNRIHRSGWPDTIDSLKEYISKEFTLEQDLTIDCYVDATFYWREIHFLDKGVIPYKGDWVGFIHHSTTGFSNALGLLFNSNFTTSLDKCKGLIVLSVALRDKLRSYYPAHVPIVVLQHPTEIPDQVWTPDKFLLNYQKNVLHVGSWYRDINQFLSLQVPSDYTKTVLKGANDDYANLQERYSHITFKDHLDNSAFDTYLSQNVVYIHLTDASAINTVLECFVRCTPIVVNKSPAVVELLGDDYPLYAENAVEAGSLLSNSSNIGLAHIHLKAKDKSTLAFDYFNKAFVREMQKIGISFQASEECCICMERIQDAHPEGFIILTCAHKFGKSCFERWKQSRGEYVTCPLCRKGRQPPESGKTRDTQLESSETSEDNSGGGSGVLGTIRRTLFGSGRASGSGTRRGARDSRVSDYYGHGYYIRDYY